MTVKEYRQPVVERLKHKRTSGYLPGQRQTQAEADRYLKDWVLPYLHPQDEEIVDLFVKMMVETLAEDDFIVVRCRGWAPCLASRERRRRHDTYELNWLAGYKLEAKGVSLIASGRWTYGLARGVQFDEAPAEEPPYPRSAFEELMT